MRIHHLIVILCCGLVTACGSSEPSFPIEETITPELMPLQGITNPITVEVKHPFLIIENWKRTDSLFHIYDLNSYELKSAFGNKGDGPNEFIFPFLFKSQSPDVLFEDQNLVYRFGINEEGQPVFKSVKKAIAIAGTANAAFINDTLYVIDAGHIAPSLYLLSLNEELPKKEWAYRNPDLLDYFSDPNAGTVYANEKRIALCYDFKKQIDFMDTDLNLIKSVKFDYDRPADTTNDGNVKLSYVNSYFGKRYLYTLFLGISWIEHMAKSTHGSFLEVFDLDGNPVARYHLDGRRPTRFAVDEETFTLYGAGEDGDPEDNLLVYKLKGLHK